jgi:hypothetical protein
MPITVTESTGTSFGEGWKDVTISEAKKGDYNGTGFMDLWFVDYPETLKCRIWEARGQDGQEFSISNMIRSCNPDILDEHESEEGKKIASLDDSLASLKGKKLQVLFYKNNNGYAEVAQKVAPAAPFKNVIDNYTEDRIDNIKASAEKYIASRKQTTETTDTESAVF